MRSVDVVLQRWQQASCSQLMSWTLSCLTWLAVWVPSAHAAELQADIDWVRIAAPAPLGAFEIARTETTVAQFRRFVQASGWVTRAERAGGGQVFEAGWVKKPGWTWSTPYGRPAADDEPAVHVDVADAQGFCRWAGGQLPTDAQWESAAYTETRAAPPAPWVKGRTYRYPTGDSPEGAQCLADCGPAAERLAQGTFAGLWRGQGHARVGRTAMGVNGLFDMGANAWEWVAPDRGTPAPDVWRTRGGSWWYGKEPMMAGHQAFKPVDTAVVYIGFRCVRPAQP
jgi:formylglycine-generating enzyme